MSKKKTEQPAVDKTVEEEQEQPQKPCKVCVVELNPLEMFPEIAEREEEYKKTIERLEAEVKKLTEALSKANEVIGSQQNLLDEYVVISAKDNILCDMLTERMLWASDNLGFFKARKYNKLFSAMNMFKQLRELRFEALSEKDEVKATAAEQLSDFMFGKH